MLDLDQEITPPIEPDRKESSRPEPAPKAFPPPFVPASPFSQNQATAPGPTPRDLPLKPFTMNQFRPNPINMVFGGSRDSTNSSPTPPINHSVPYPHGQPPGYPNHFPTSPPYMSAGHYHHVSEPFISPQYPSYPSYAQHPNSYGINRDAHNHTPSHYSQPRPPFYPPSGRPYQHSRRPDEHTFPAWWGPHPPQSRFPPPHQNYNNAIRIPISANDQPKPVQPGMTDNRSPVPEVSERFESRSHMLDPQA